MRKELYSSLSRGLKPSEIGELIGTIGSPSMISFAAGVPAAEFFPLEALAASSAEVILHEGADILQYGDQQGNKNLRQLLSTRMQSAFGIHTGFTNIQITSGSQQGLDICARLFLEKGDVLLVEEPTYVDALNTLTFSGATAVGMPLGVDGPDLEFLASQLEQDNRIKLIYVIPDYQNPTGGRWSYEHRHAFMDIVQKYEVIVIEDNPYGEIRYTEECLPTLQSLDTKGQVIFLGSFSKILSPGIRLGWMVAGDKHIKAINLVKERCDIHTSSLDQAIVARYLEAYSLDEHIRHLRTVYQERRDCMCAMIDKHLPQCSYTLPQGGLFLWITLPKDIDALALFEKATDSGVAFVPGHPFYTKKNNYEHIRLNFSGVTPEEIQEGIIRLAKAFQCLA